MGFGIYKTKNRGNCMQVRLIIYCQKSQMICLPFCKLTHSSGDGNSMHAWFMPTNTFWQWHIGFSYTQ